MSEQEPVPPEPLPLGDAARRIFEAGGALGRDLTGAGAALGELAAAEFALSRSAVLRAVLLLAFVVVLGMSAWLYAMAATALGLRALGLAWWAAVGIPALISLVAALTCLWLARTAMVDASFQRTRRVFAQLRRPNPTAANDGEQEGTT